MSQAKPGYVAVVTGATGAIGRHIVAELLASSKWQKITTIGRRPLQLPEELQKKAADGRLVQQTVDMDNLEAHQDAFATADVHFCALGTTRKDAGSAEAFRKVDYDYVLKLAQMSKQANTSIFSLVSSSGASQSSPFLYMKTKGQIEQAVADLGYPHTAIWRPGLLARGEDARWTEKLASWLMSTMPTARVAKAMRLEAEAKLEAGMQGEPTKVVYGNADINNFVN